jgi:CubicO group peptidase (beta-lactamase class C family)
MQPVDETANEAVAIGGSVEPGYEGVREAFARNFVEHGDVGAACTLYVDGRRVVDLWGGVADVDTGAPYRGDTLQLVFSSTKGATALCANLLAQRGELDVDAPVASYWPEFGRDGKDDVTVRWLLCHKAGLPFVDADLTLDEALAWDPVVDALAAQRPHWEPGSAHGYHAVTYGWLVGEVVRRITGRTVGVFFADEVAGPLGLDLWIGLPEDQWSRVAPLTNRGLPPGVAAGGDGRPGDDGQSGADGAGGDGESESLTEMVDRLLGPGSLLVRALGGVSGVFTGDGVFNRPEVWSAELPAANAVGDARSLARMYAATIGPVEGSDLGPLLTAEQVAAASACQTTGGDQVLVFPTTFGLGFMTSSPFSPYGGSRGFGHAGAGGSVGFADPEHGVAFAYVMNRMMANLSGDPRTRDLVKASYDALGVTPAHV